MSIFITQAATSMGIPPHSKAVIDGEFRRMKTIREIRLDHDIMAFLDDVHASLNVKGATNSRGPFKRPLLHYAAMGNCTELIHFLLQNGAAVDGRDQNKRTALFWAAEYGALDAVKILLANGAKINARDDMFSTAVGSLLYAGNPMGQIAGTEAYLREMGAKEKGAKRRWIWDKIEWLKRSARKNQRHCGSLH